MPSASEELPRTLRGRIRSRRNLDDASPREEVVNEELCLPFFPNRAPPTHRHHVPLDLRKVPQIVVVERVRELCVPICERPRTADASCVADVADKMYDAVLAASVVLVPR